jgi:tyrosinase
MADKNGFGGNGNLDLWEWTDAGSGLQCVETGPFAKLRPEYLEEEPKKLSKGGHCLYRKMPEVTEPDAYKQMVPTITPEGIKELQTSGNWTHFATATEGGPHGTIHASLGGEMNPTTSPNEPLFFMHHAQIDRVWWQWQQKNAKRFSEYNGQGMHYPNRVRESVNLDDVLPMFGLAKDVKVRDVMNPSKGPLCYRY